MNSFIKTFLIIASGIITLIFSGVYIQLLMWDYNEEGNHFEVQTPANYIDNGVVTLGLLTGLF